MVEMILRGNRRITHGMALLLAGVFCTTVAAHGQTVKCPVAQKLTLDQMVKFVDQKLPDERTEELIDSCHVSFSLDSTAIERLTRVGITDPVLDALGRETALLLSVEQAHAEVAELESHIAELDKTTAAERDAALQKLDADYQAQRAKEAHIDPKSEFESTTEYNARVQQKQKTLAAMDSKHEADRNELAAQYARNAGAHSQRFQQRITFLEKYMYPDSRAIAYGHYNADGQRLTATIGSDEYSFDTVPSKTAQTLHDNWKQVKVVQPYADDDGHTRSLVLEAGTISAKGYSHTAKIAKMLADAQARMARRDYQGAVTEYQSVLGADAENKEAQDGLAAAKAAIQKEINTAKELSAFGAWADQQKQLMWTLRNNGRDIDWKGANAYCETLRTGGFSDWRLPTTEEFYYGSWRYQRRISEYNLWAVPEEVWVKDYSGFWSGSREDADTAGALVMRGMTGSPGITPRVPASRKENMRAICVRHYEPPA
jgi:hypothetical protein